MLLHAAPKALRAGLGAVAPKRALKGPSNIACRPSLSSTGGLYTFSLYNLNRIYHMLELFYWGLLAGAIAVVLVCKIAIQRFSTSNRYSELNGMQISQQFAPFNTLCRAYDRSYRMQRCCGQRRLKNSYANILTLIALLLVCNSRDGSFQESAISLCQRQG